MKKKIKVIIAATLLSPLILLLVYVCGMCFITAVVMGFNITRDTLTWRDRTSPLDPSVTQDLCQKLHLPSDDSRCISGATVYAPEFFTTLGRTFQPENGDRMTFEEVDAVLGKYQFDKEPVIKQADGLEYFRVWYDLKGDRVYPIVVDFYSDGRLLNMIADISD